MEEENKPNESVSEQENVQEDITPTPPPIRKSVDDEWAEKLGVPNNVPPIPNKQEEMQGKMHNAQCTMHNGIQNPQFGPEFDPQFGPQYGPQFNPQSGQQFNPQSGQQPDPQFGPQFNPQSGQQPPMPKSYLLWSVLCTALCCMIPGIVAIFYSARVSSKYFIGDYAGAQKASQNAEIWIIVSFVLGVLSNTLYLPIALAAGL